MDWFWTILGEKDVKDNQQCKGCSKRGHSSIQKLKAYGWDMSLKSNDTMGMAITDHQADA